MSKLKQFTMPRPNCPVGFWGGGHTPLSDPTQNGWRTRATSDGGWVIWNMHREGVMHLLPVQARREEPYWAWSARGGKRRITPAPRYLYRCSFFRATPAEVRDAVNDGRDRDLRKAVTELGTHPGVGLTVIELMGAYEAYYTGASSVFPG